jgi:predicted nucleic acid-binding protein
MGDVVLDANVLVGYLDAHDVQHARASALIERLEAEGHEGVLLDVLVAEVSVLCRRARERKSSPPNLTAVLDRIRRWHEEGEIEPGWSDVPRFFVDILDVIEKSAGLVVLQRNAMIDDVASFDEGFDKVDGFRRLA